MDVRSLSSHGLPAQTSIMGLRGNFKQQNKVGSVWASQTVELVPPAQASPDLSGGELLRGQTRYLGLRVLLGLFWEP